MQLDQSIRLDRKAGDPSIHQIINNSDKLSHQYVILPREPLSTNEIIQIPTQNRENYKYPFLASENRDRDNFKLPCPLLSPTEAGIKFPIR